MSNTLCCSRGQGSFVQDHVDRFPGWGAVAAAGAGRGPQRSEPPQGRFGRVWGSPEADSGPASPLGGAEVRCDRGSTPRVGLYPVVPPCHARWLAPHNLRLRPERGFCTRSAAPVTSPASRCDRCSAFTQHPPDLACPSADLRASTSCLPQAGTKRQPGRRASGRCKVSSGVLTPLGRPPGLGGLMARRSPKISGEGPGLGAPAPAGCPGRLGGAQCDLHH